MVTTQDTTWNRTSRGVNTAVRGLGLLLRATHLCLFYQEVIGGSPHSILDQNQSHRSTGLNIKRHRFAGSTAILDHDKMAGEGDTG